MSEQRINWYPGHMARSRRLLEGQLRAVDAVVELCDARAPMATRNPDLNRLTQGKTRLLVLNKSDLADDAVTAEWLKVFRGRGIAAMRFNSNGTRAKEITARIEEAVAPAMERAARRGIRKTARLMVIGIPNVGKSTFINRIHGSRIVQAQDRPGVTRANRWVKIGPYLELLDTPGLLAPRLDDQEEARLLAYLGSVRDQILNTEQLAAGLLALLIRRAPEQTRQRFRLSAETWESDESILEDACRGRGWLLPGGRCDTDRAAALVLDEYRGGKVGKISLQEP